MAYTSDKYERHLEMLAAAGFMTDFPRGDGDNRYSVCTGSHSGSGRTPQAAVKACLRCCNIKHYWTLSDDGRLARDVVAEILVEASK